MPRDEALRGAAGPVSQEPRGPVWAARVLTGIFTRDPACYEDVLLLAEMPSDVVNKAIIPVRAPTKPSLPGTMVGTYATHVPVASSRCPSEQASSGCRAQLWYSVLTFFPVRAPIDSCEPDAWQIGL